MSDILDITGPVFLAIAIGWLCARLRLFTADEFRVIGRFVIQIAFPCVLFVAMTRQPIDGLVDVRFVIGYAAGSALLFGAMLAWSRFGWRTDRLSAVYAALGVSCSNSGFVGYPLLLLTLPDQATRTFAMTLLIENLLILPMVFVLAELAHGGGHGIGGTLAQVGRAFVRNPMILGLAAGVLASLAHWHPPVAVERTLQMFSQGSAAAALFVIGGPLAARPLTSIGLRPAVIAATKLLLHPLAVFAMLYALGLTPLGRPPAALIEAAVIVAAAPMLGIYPLLAGRHGREAQAASSLLIATVAAFFTLSALLWALRNLLPAAAS